jgi:hypothetical protein
MDDNDRHSETDKPVPFNQLTARTKILGSVSQILRRVEGPDPSGDTTSIKVYSFVKTRWMQRVLRWFKRG